MLMITRFEYNPDVVFFSCPECEKRMSFHISNVAPLMCEECRALLPDVKAFAAFQNFRLNYHLDHKKEYFS